MLASSLAASARRSPRWAASTSALVSSSATDFISVCSSYSCCEQAFSSAAISSPSPSPPMTLPSVRSTRARIAAPTPSIAASVARRSSSSCLAVGNPFAQRLAVALAEQSLGAAGVADRPLGAAADVAQRRLPGRLGRLGGAGDAEAGQRGAEAGVDLAQLLLELARPLGRGAAGADVEGQRPEFGPQRLQARLQLGVAAGETGGADGDPLLLAAQLRHQAPGLGALAVARGEALLGLAAAFADRGQPLFDPGPGRSRLGGGLLGDGGPVGAEAQLLGDQLRPQAQLLALDPGADLGCLGLALERAQTGARLALDVERPVEIVAGGAQLQLGPAAALAVLAETGGLLDQEAALARFGVDDRLDPPLAITECISRPRLVSERTSVTSASRQRAPLRR